MARRTLTTRDRRGLAAARQQTKLVRKLREIRVDRGKSVADVANELGVDPSVIYRFEKGGTNPTLATIRKYALAVDASLTLDAEPAERSEEREMIEGTAKQMESSLSNAISAVKSLGEFHANNYSVIASRLAAVSVNFKAGEWLDSPTTTSTRIVTHQHLTAGRA